ncbi:putative DNA-binding transcriptional regulator YafY [Actinomycetospora succinea]|uniref:Putative DNA-binding transcriptional regulator YafY n=1 Tax=Actinomycetospora succinea TaxID=663603 RepID=A0A4R6VJ79_9PSEU|nr:YafY family protein [Actinomycetospora succinea]TDQ62886.1 putative DNA-binding transcriptional regulator YafY [Actinomycetospora succinea]
MRASRLLSVLLLLQNRGRLTARELADELEVSIRTIYRDMDALSASGVPVYADRGPDGGYSLLEGYRTHLTGMTAEEADALALSGMPDAAAELGLGRVLAAAQLKVQAALPGELSDRAGRIAERFHLDAPGWFREADHVPTLTGVADAVWNQRVLRVRYRRWATGGREPEVERELAPLGLVLKAGTWYLVAVPSEEPNAEPRTYRVARILELETLDIRFDRPEGFDLWKYWHQRTQELTDALYQAEATVRFSPRALELAPVILRPHTARALAEGSWPTDDDGWVRAVIPIESLAHARSELLALGAEVEVLAPPALREQMAETARTLASLYPV